MFHKLIPYFKLQIRICNIFFLTPYEWPKEQKYPNVFRSSFKSKLYRITLLSQWIYVSIMLINFTFTVSDRKSPIASKLLGTLFLDCFMVTLILRTVVLRLEQETLHMISSFLQFEQLNPEAITLKADTMGKILITLGMMTSYGLPCLMMAILLVDPCKPPHIGYMLYNTEHGCLVPNIFIRISLLAFDFFMWVNSIGPACYYVFNYMFLGLRCLDHYIKMVSRKMHNKGNSFANCKTKANMLRENWSKDVSGNKSSSCASSPSIVPAPTTRAELLEVKRISNNHVVAHNHAEAFYIYRQIHILSRFYANILQSVFFPAIITAALSCVIISLYACLKLHKQIPMPGLAFFPLLACDGLSVIFIIKIASAVLIQSTKFLDTVNSNWKFSNKSLFKKIARSLGKVKVKFGSTNYVDQLTPFIFIDFCITNTVNLMLIL